MTQSHGTIDIEPGIRRCRLARFPYGLIYGVDGGTLVVVAVAQAALEQFREIATDLAMTERATEDIEGTPDE